ncbi:MAG: nucleotidyltransferase [Cellvibrionaceae bacterium]|nr:nucleotidyltransferase [Cellvibrionaceae bacterium]|tara:strand:- start:41903 stop:43816 length:1914 start_codon:yes stop_codon:yes gene_type:complete
MNEYTNPDSNSSVVATGLSPELSAVKDFLAECIPFDTLSDDQLNQLAPAIEVCYYRQGHIFRSEDDAGGLRIIRSGAAELRVENDRLIDRFGETVSFNLLGLSQEQPGIRATLIEDSLIYYLAEVDYQRLRKQYRDFDRFFHSQRSRRVRRAARHETTPSEMMRRVKDLMSSNVLSVAPVDSIQTTAQLMSEHRISSVLVMQDEQLKGIVTDRDIRSRAVALGLDVAEPIERIMTVSPDTIFDDETLFDATLFMTQKGYHHIPVVSAHGEDSRAPKSVVGIVTSSDLMLARRDDPVYLVQHVNRQQTVKGLKDITALLPDLLAQWVNAGIKSTQVGHVLTAISDAVTIRLIAMAEQELGPAPAPFCWLGFGSQGREEQLLGGDQDNALLISDDVKDSDLAWFEKMAHRVCDGLNECGYVYCPGEVMATTKEWRQPLQGWKQTVDRWTRSPTSDAVMRVSIFFDVRAVHGDASLAKQLQAHMLKRTKGNSIFLAALAENVLDAPPPLGIFRRFVVDHNGEHRDELNLKKRAVIPIVDLVRIHSLAHGIQAVNTVRRLHALADAKVMSIGDSRNLQDALQVIMQTRVEAQVQQLMNAEKPTNYLNPDELPKLVRKQLRDAFSVVKDAQQSIRLNYRPGL